MLGGANFCPLGDRGRDDIAIPVRLLITPHSMGMPFVTADSNLTKDSLKKLDHFLGPPYKILQRV